MKWKFVFNPKAFDSIEGTLYNACKKAKEAGYLFLMWNGSVRDLNGESIGITEIDMI